MLKDFREFAMRGRLVDMAVGISDAPAAPPPTPEDVMLLREIRDSLKVRRVAA